MDKSKESLIIIWGKIILNLHELMYLLLSKNPKINIMNKDESQNYFDFNYLNQYYFYELLEKEDLLFFSI